MTNPFIDQAMFMAACGQVTTAASPGQAMLYKDLIHEEHDEFLQAQTDVEEADACVDLLVVVIGYMISRGWDTQALWAEVVRSNMAKIGPDGKVRRRSDGKILKPDGWTPPDIAGVLAQ
jgi:predicted HAD superfamily Cof-like phosphohydrolase